MSDNIKTISDDELEKMADQFICGGGPALTFPSCFKAGFRKSESLRSVQWPPYSEWPEEIHALIAVARMVKDIRLDHQLKRVDKFKERVMQEITNDRSNEQGGYMSEESNEKARQLLHKWEHDGEPKIIMREDQFTLLHRLQNVFEDYESRLAESEAKLKIAISALEAIQCHGHGEACCDGHMAVKREALAKIGENVADK
jgi:hypothetical protein